LDSDGGTFKPEPGRGDDAPGRRFVGTPAGEAVFLGRKPGQIAKEAFDNIQPGAAGRNEMKAESGIFL
jgi:hypothetical protein